MTRTQNFLLAVGSAFALAVAYLGGRHGQGADLQGLSDRVDQLQQQQAKLQEAYLTGSPRAKDDLARDLGYRRVLTRQGREATDGIGDDPGKLTGEDQTRETSDLKQSLEREFSSEPVNPQWASQATNTVQNAIVEISATEGTTPGMVQVDCRSSMCRIHLNLRDRDEAGLFTESLFADIGSNLPTAKTVFLPSDDGQSMEVFIFSRKAGPH